MTLADFINDLKAGETIATQGISTLESLDPAVTAEAEIAKVAVGITSQLLNAALTAFSNASGTPITVETLTALLPNATPLAPPTPPPAA